MVSISAKVRTTHLYCADCNQRINDEFCAELGGFPINPYDRNSRSVNAQLHRSCASRLAEDFIREMS